MTVDGVPISGFRDQKMDMLGHHDVSDDYESVLLPRLFEDRKKAGACARRIKERQAVIARVSDKVQLLRTVSSMQAGWHDNLMVSAASFPALAKSARTGHPQFRNGKGKKHSEAGPPAKSHPIIIIARLLSSEPWSLERCQVYSLVRSRHGYLISPGKEPSQF